VVVTIPNATILSSQILNYSSHSTDQGLILHTSVTIGYDVPWRTVHRLLLNAASATPQILAEPMPFVLQRSLNDFTVDYELNAYTRNAGSMPAIYSSLHQQIQDAFHAAGVEIMSPHYTAFRDGSRLAIPQQNNEDV
jgi:small-conductance mechanosensitive channel